MKAWRKACGAIFAISFLWSSCAVTNASDFDQKAAAAVDEVFGDFAKPGSPGCALGVYRDGQIIYAKGYGLANLEENVPITPQSVFDIGSTSKQFTAASILLLEKQGKLSVNDDVRGHIPELPDYGQKITILHLLNHTSGLRDYLTLMELAGINTDSVTTDEDALALIVRQRGLNFAPGSEWLYSNTGFFLLSVIVKRVSGKTLREFATENIFQPLGMTHTQFRDDHTSLIADRAMAYDADEKREGYTINVSYFEQTGDGAVHTSVEDLLKWDQNFYTGTVGGKIFLAELQEHGKLNSGKILDYAKGLTVAEYRGLHTVRHGGAWGGYRAELLRFPDQHFSVACLCNISNANPSRRANEVADVYLGSVMKPRDAKEELDEDPKKESHGAPLKAEQLQGYAGDYWAEELGVTYRLGLADGNLKVAGILDRSGLPRTNHFSPSELRPAGDDRFTIGSDFVTVKFKRDGTGAASGFELDAGRTAGVAFTRVAAARNEQELGPRHDGLLREMGDPKPGDTSP
jgi:CubicO group peptidase (beta-lactamase class C family)